MKKEENKEVTLRAVDESAYQAVGTKYSGASKRSGEALLSITNATSNRITLSAKILEEKMACKEGDNIEVLMGKDSLLITKSDTDAITLRATANKYNVYNKELVQKVTEVLSLDFTVRTSYSVYDYELVQYKGKTALYVSKDNFVI